MSLEAMWSVYFIANEQNAGSGVVVLESGRVFGGDSSFIYHGEYDCKDGFMKARVRVRRHHFTWQDQPNVFEVDDFVLNLEGEWDHNSFTLKNSSEKSPSLGVEVQFHREEELP